MLGFNHQHQKNNTSEETGLSQELGPQQVQHVTQTIQCDSLQLWVQSRSWLLFSGLQMGPKEAQIPHLSPTGLSQGLKFHLKFDFFFFVRHMYLYLAVVCFSSRHIVIPCLVQGPSHLFYFHFVFALFHKPTPVPLFHRSSFQNILYASLQSTFHVFIQINLVLKIYNAVCVLIYVNDSV